MSLIDFHAKKMEQAHPDMKCPIEFAKTVLRSLGVTLSEVEIKIFASDLALARMNDNKGEN